MIILNERKMAEEIIESGTICNSPSYTLMILGKYYRQVESLSVEDTFIKLDSFMKTYYQGYNSAKWEGFIEDVSKKSVKYKLREIDSISITESELDSLSLLGNTEQEKLVFTMLCFSKLFNKSADGNNNWVNTKIDDLLKISRVKARAKKDKYLMIHDVLYNQLIEIPDEDGVLNKSSLISLSNRDDNLNIRVNFVDDYSKAVIEITDFRELGYEYLLYKGGKYSRCKECGILFRQNKNGTASYCSEHRGYNTIHTKIIECIDCGNDIIVDNKDNKTCRCSDCKLVNARFMARERKRKQREKTACHAIN